MTAHPGIGAKAPAIPRRSFMTVDSQDVLLQWFERAVLVFLALYLFLHVLPRAWRSLITDFPNYYTAAQLADQHFDTSRMYEWQWIEREKDHRAIPIRVIGLVPITPFSTLFVWPLTHVDALTAKRAWIVFTLLLLVPIAWMLHSMTDLSYRRIALIFALSFPLYSNLEDGQFYVLLLLIVAAACWAYLGGFVPLAGAFVALAAASKIFPLILFVFFLQKRAWRALVSGTLAGVVCIATSTVVFGWSVHRTYLREILPATVHGEAMPPYVTNASISGILHILFLNEPQWNPAPWRASVPAFSILLPLLSMLLLAPAILLIRRADHSPRRILLEWSALLTGSLTVSTIPASYNFVLMALPMCVLSSLLLEHRRYAWLAAALAAYIGVGFSFPASSHVSGLAILLYTPRLPLMIALLLGFYALLLMDRSGKSHSHDWSRVLWAAAMLIAVVAAARSTYLRERAVRAEYAYRLPNATQGYLDAELHSDGSGLRYIAFTLDGYHLMRSDGTAVLANQSSDPFDELSFTAAGGRTLVEQAGAPQSNVFDLSHPANPVIRDARDPALSADAASLAFVRDDHGRGRLMIQQLIKAEAGAIRALTPPELNVYEASFLSESRYAFAASDRGRPPQIYLTDAAHSNSPLPLGESRYPALSLDGRWMAYSHFENGAWNLWVRDQASGVARRVGNVPCNEIQPTWESDSKTLLYSTDCGRSLWFTAVARRRVIP
jgi:Glycosyltransferase family 87/WD40-like Beta Propeller Repeat